MTCVEIVRIDKGKTNVSMVQSRVRFLQAREIREEKNCQGKSQGNVFFEMPISITPGNIYLKIS